MKIIDYKLEIYKEILDRPLGDSNGPSGNDLIYSSILKIETDEGITGIAPLGNEYVKEFFPILENEDPREVFSIWKKMIDMRAVNVVQPDVCYLGGVTRTLKVAEMALQAELPCTPHSANLSLVTVFTLHIMGALKNAGPYVEFSIEGTDYYPWQEGIYDPALVVKDGKVQIPDGPGWGVEINPDFLEKSQYQISNL